MKTKGFTLIEVLVVVSILGVLMGLVSVLVLKSASHRQKTEAKQMVQAYLPTKIQRFQDQFNRFPPMTLEELNRFKVWKTLGLSGNETNLANELLLVALRHPDFTDKLEDGDLPGSDVFGNNDEDVFDSRPEGSPKADAMEITDPWGNPVVYISKNHYRRPVQILNKDGDIVEVEALRRGKNGQYYRPTSFQVISLGRDGMLDEHPGQGDDIYNFTLDDEE